MNKHQIYESCENFVNRLYVNYPRLFKSLNDILLQYQDNPSISKTIISQSLLNLLKDDPGLESQLYELFLPPSEVQNEPSFTIENVQGQITEAFRLIQGRKPDKISGLIAFFTEKTRNQNHQKDPMDIRNKALECFREYFKEDVAFFQEVSACFALKEAVVSTPKTNKEETSLILKKKKSEVIKERLIITPSKTEIFLKKPPHSPCRPSLLMGSNPEENFFANLKNRLSDSQLSYFFKVFYLYLENVISSREFFECVTDLFPEEGVFLYFRNLVLSREVAHRKAALYFKPYSDIDLQNLNREWISIPIGSEHYTFCNMRKNTYEEALFKIEDEKFDLDTAILLLKRGLKLVALWEKQAEKSKKSEIVKNILRLKVLKKTDILDESPDTIEYIKSKLTEKLQEAENNKANAKKGWREVAEKNFQKSLDHQLFYFKKQEKILYTSINFLKEVEERRHFILSDPMNSHKYLESFNTFEGLTLSFGCKRAAPQNCEKLSPSFLSNVTFPPIFTFEFHETRVLEDCLSIIWQFISYSHFTHHDKPQEKEKLKKLLKSIFQTGLNVALHPSEKSKEDIQETIQALRQKLEDRRSTDNVNENPPETENSGENIKEICQEIIQNIENNIFSNAAEDSSMNTHKEITTKLRITNPNFKTLNLLEDEPKRAANKDQLFYPDADSKDFLLYGTKHFFFFMRFFYSFYEQILMAFQLSSKFENESFFSEEEKARLTKERYRVFKLVLTRNFLQKIDSAIFENNLRSIFGNNAFLLATSEKILISVFKSLQNLASENLSNDFSDIVNAFKGKFANSPKINEKLCFQRLDELVLRKIQNPKDRILFRAVFKGEFKKMYVSIFETESKDWEIDKKLAVEEYLKFQLNQPVVGTHCSGERVFLKRNRLSKRKFGDWISENFIEYHFVENSGKMVSSNNSKEDFMIFKGQSKKIKIERVLEKEFEKSIKIRKWVEEALILQQQYEKK